MMFLVQNVMRLTVAAIQELCMYNSVFFPLQAAVPVADSFLHFQEWHHTSRIPPGSLERTWGIKPTAE